MRSKLPSSIRFLGLRLAKLPLVSPRVLCGSVLITAAALGAIAADKGLAFVPQKAIEGPWTLANFTKGATDCFDRSKRPALAVVDTHLHVRPFGGPPIPYQELTKILRQNGVLFANLYGIGQRLPVQSPCTYYLNCPGEPALPSLKSDFSNAQNLSLIHI